MNRRIALVIMIPGSIPLIVACNRFFSPTEPDSSLPSGTAPRDMWLADAISPFGPVISREWLNKWNSEFVLGFKQAYDRSVVFAVNGRSSDLGVTTKKLRGGERWETRYA